MSLYNASDFSMSRQKRVILETGDDVKTFFIDIRTSDYIPKNDRLDHTAQPTSHARQYRQPPDK